MRNPRFVELAGFRSKPSTLCSHCQELDFFKLSGLSIEYESEDLEARATTCDLCALFWKTARRHNRTGLKIRIRLDRVQSLLRMEGVCSPVLSICRSPGMNSCLPWKRCRSSLPR